MTQTHKAGEKPPGGPYSILERKHGTVTITNIMGPDDERLIQTTGRPDEIIVGHDAAHARAHELADELD
jgi:hypothetical protein